MARLIPVSDETLQDRAMPALYCDIGASAHERTSALRMVELPNRRLTPTHWDVHLVGDLHREITGLLGATPEALLVIEAPLSRRFAADGCPRRREFETPTCSWYTGAGAATLLSTLQFLRALAQDEDGPIIHLAEGFVVNKYEKRDNKRVPKPEYQRWLDRVKQQDESKSSKVIHHLADTLILEHIHRGEPGTGEIIRSETPRLQDCRTILEFLPNPEPQMSELPPPVLRWRS